MTSGTAYALADRDVRPHLPDIKRVLQPTSGMYPVSLDVMERRGPYTAMIAEKARAAGIASVVEITGKHGIAAQEGRGFLNQFYQTDAYSPEDPFVGGVVYQEGGRTVEDTGTFRPRFGRN